MLIPTNLLNLEERTIREKGILIRISTTLEQDQKTLQVLATLE